MKKKYIIFAQSSNDYHKNMLFEEEGWKVVPKPHALFDNWYKVVSPQKFWKVLKQTLKLKMEEDEFGFYASVKWSWEEVLEIIKDHLKNGHFYSIGIYWFVIKTPNDKGNSYELFE